MKFKNFCEDSEKTTFFEQRTNYHINLVKEFCQKIYEYDSTKFKDLRERAEMHDQSKFTDDERAPYTYLTWKYKCKKEGVKFEECKELEEQFKEAWKHHYMSNPHHPEGHHDIKTMDHLDLAEMVADWMAMGVEMGNTAKEWADKNIGSRWEFTPEQTELVYELIKEIE